MLGDCTTLLLSRIVGTVDLTFLDPPFNQSKEYAEHDDSMEPAEYWNWMKTIAQKVYDLTTEGGAIYFMQREKNTEHVLQCLRESGWVFQNLIVWKKKTSAVPGNHRYGKQYQVIAFATKGKTPRVFNRLRINPPLPQGYKYERENGMFVTDIWDDIRELTSGYFAGEEPLRDKEGNRLHKQQSPIELLTRIILSSSMPGDKALDPFAGTGTTAVVANQLGRTSVSIELDLKNVNAIKKRCEEQKPSDDIGKFYAGYRYTSNLEEIWGQNKEKQFLERSLLKKQISLL
ncbi:MAG: site-specific DNA-methyltransferase [Bacteroidetes bacterium]|nr:MAG: site-specific DNA-methyltransferase [Bacteroidota bacterium]